MSTKKKNIILPNECSVWRWAATAAAGIFFGIILLIPFSILTVMIPEFMTITIGGITGEVFSFLFSFAALFWGFVIALKLIAKTSVRDFIFGTGSKIQVKESFALLVVYIVGIIISALPTANNIYFRGVVPAEFVILILFMLVMAWMQTTFEEFLFRGVFIRWACGNNIGFTKKSILTGLFSTILFAVMHTANPEVTSLSGLQAALTVLTYAIPGFMLYILDLYCKSLFPGILIHWFNNFFAFTILANEVSAVPSQTLLVDGSVSVYANYGGMVYLIGTLIPYSVVSVYILYKHLKKKKTAN